MSENAADNSRRHFLTIAATVTGGVGAGLAAIPFMASMAPSARTKALGAPVEVDLSALEIGAILKIEWRGQPILIVRRSDEALATLSKVPDLKDPDSVNSIQPEFAVNEYRAREAHKNIVVLSGNCTHLGCVPKLRATPTPEVGPDWNGGFYCVCHGSKFDYAGRVIKESPAPTNLTVPPYRYVNDFTLVIGEMEAEA